MIAGDGQRQRTLLLANATSKDLDAVAAELGLPISTLADALLQFTLEQWRAGCLRIAKRPVAWEVDGVFVADPDRGKP